MQIPILTLKKHVKNQLTRCSIISMAKLVVENLLANKKNKKLIMHERSIFYIKKISYDPHRYLVFTI